ncbi:MAG: tetratricopeptide repeat protein [Bacteroidota bacterium]
MADPRRTVFLIGCALLLGGGCGGEKRLSSDSPEALNAYREGLVAWERFYYPEAKRAFERATVLDSSFAMAWCRLAMVNAAARNLPAARSAMQQALRHSAGISRRERLFISMWHKRLSYDNAGAAAAVDSLLKLYPDEKEGYLFRGNLAEELDKDYDTAVRYYQKAVDADTSYAQAVMSLGYAYSNLGDQQRAVEQMQRYIQLAPADADPRASYADLLVRAGRYDDALEQYRKSLELKPDYWYSIREIGRVYAILGRLRAAEEQYHRSLELLPESPQLEASHLVADGMLNVKRGKLEVAAEQFRKALAIDSVNGDAAYGLLSALTKTGQFGAAAQVADRIKEELQRRNLTHSPSMLGYHLMRARLLTAQGSLEEAKAACDSALQYSVPLTRAAVYRQMAEIFLARGDFEDALDACEEALTLNQNAPDVLLTLTRIYHRKGDAQMTVEIGSRLLALWSEADPDFVDRNEVLRILGKKPAV